MKQTRQHQPLRRPSGWNGDAASLVVQIDSLFDEVYRLISNLERKVKELEEGDDE